MGRTCSQLLHACITSCSPLLSHSHDLLGVEDGADNGGADNGGVDIGTGDGDGDSDNWDEEKARKQEEASKTAAKQKNKGGQGCRMCSLVNSRGLKDVCWVHFVPPRKPGIRTGRFHACCVCYKRGV